MTGSVQTEHRDGTTLVQGDVKRIYHLSFAKVYITIDDRQAEDSLLRHIVNSYCTWRDTGFRTGHPLHIVSTTTGIYKGIQGEGEELSRLLILPLNQSQPQWICHRQEMGQHLHPGDCPWEAKGQSK